MELSVKCHKVPMKLLHENPALGQATMEWLYDLLQSGALRPPEVETVEGGLRVVNENLDRLRKGEAGGKRIVVQMDTRLEASQKSTSYGASSC